MDSLVRESLRCALLFRSMSTDIQRVFSAVLAGADASSASFPGPLISGNKVRTRINLYWSYGRELIPHFHRETISPWLWWISSRTPPCSWAPASWEPSTLYSMQTLIFEFLTALAWNVPRGKQLGGWRRRRHAMSYCAWKLVYLSIQRSWSSGDVLVPLTLL